MCDSSVMSVRCRWRCAAVSVGYRWRCAAVAPSAISLRSPQLFTSSLASSLHCYRHSRPLTGAIQYLPLHPAAVTVFCLLCEHSALCRPPRTAVCSALRGPRRLRLRRPCPLCARFSHRVPAVNPVISYPVHVGPPCAFKCVQVVGLSGRTAAVGRRSRPARYQQ